jgi:hypothetical protein
LHEGEPLPLAGTDNHENTPFIEREKHEAGKKRKKIRNFLRMAAIMVPERHF